MKILSVDDNSDNLYLIEMIGRSHGHEVVSAHNGVEALEELAKQSFDLIVSDVLMPAMDGFQLCRTVKNDERLQHIPFMFYTATYTAKQDEELGLALGASRFMVKPVEPEEFVVQIEEVLHESELGKIPVPAVDLADDDKRLSLYNERLVRKLERKMQQLEAARDELAATIENKNCEIAQRRRTEEALGRSEEQLRLMWDSSMDGMLLTDREGIILRANPAFSRMAVKSPESLSGQRFTCIYGGDSASVLAEYCERVESRSIEPHFEMSLQRWDGARIWIEASSAIIDLPSGPVVFSVVRDVTERKRSEQERAALQEQLRQAQKLESVGRLAGGMAHDFNNMLTVINGYSELMLNQLHASDPLREYAEQIHVTGARAADLTHRLLAFSRKQALKPQVMDLNGVVAEMRSMLARLVGEDVALMLELHPEPARIYADRHQFQQVLMNLVVNARDAMPTGGELRIVTNVLEWGRGEVEARPGARIGSYVMLTVSDNGEGMTEETRQQIFEPFFTTKEVGKGTGLGLSMVQGIVAQSDGFIDVRSEPGRGTTFEIYLPGIEGAPADSEMALPPTEELHGTETVLVVEDQAEVRKYVAAALGIYGYRVMQAVDAEEALQICERERGRLDLLLTDLVMPKGSGKELADRVEQRYPGIRILFMSGYAGNATLRRGLPMQGINFIQKPFKTEELAKKIRELLMAPSDWSGPSTSDPA